MKKETIEKRKKARQNLYQKIDDQSLNLGEAVRLIRETLGLNQVEFAKKVGVSKFSVTKIEKNEGNPTIKSVNKMLAPMKLELRVTEKKGF